MPFSLQSFLVCPTNFAANVVPECETSVTVAIIRQRMTSSTLARKQQIRKAKAAVTSPTIGIRYKTPISPTFG